ncbi:hypothetical protein [Chitinophaga flava]|uniref:Uncharacterized protein n=1 Tax=Chitinophaga flava TaxID=2259036 RepID=A0A365XXT6_9BACT|nr:hypothetical protein [Chitinophaga flava]RBL91162.1 hypothetical protein DF182_00630 [Chitinophaga flava]
MDNFLFKVNDHVSRWLTLGQITDISLSIIPNEVDQGDTVILNISFNAIIKQANGVKPDTKSKHSYLHLNFFPDIQEGALHHVYDEVYQEGTGDSKNTKTKLDINGEMPEYPVTIISHWQLNTTDCSNSGYAVQPVINSIQKDKNTVTYLDVNDPKQIYIRRSALNATTSINTSLQPSATPFTRDLTLWLLILKGTEAISFDNYMKHMDFIFCGSGDVNNKKELGKLINNLKGKRLLPFTDTDAYRSLKVATEAFLMVNCGVSNYGNFSTRDVEELYNRVTLKNGDVDKSDLDNFWNQYLVSTNGTNEKVLPYLAIIRRKLGDQGIKHITMDQALDSFGEDGQHKMEKTNCVGIISDKLSNPCFLELIWSYWHEESMMVQAMGAISRRFQNMRGNGTDPLANLEIDPLRPLNNLIWGYIQDEQHRLSLRRRTLEYDHHYGISLQGKAVGNLRTADSRSKFIEAFHNLLNTTLRFYKQLDDTTVVADGFPVLNALKEVHLILSEGAHNQFGDLPSTARIEMLMQQWLLARPEFREFLPTRIMVAYPEAWMDRVAAMNSLQNWTKTSVLHFRDLGVFGEQLLLTVRFGNWASISDRNQAANWAKFWREQIQGYVHAYRAVTGMDLGLENGKIDVQQPSLHLLRRLKEQTIR